MGCDGGTIPRRDELVRTKKKPEQKDKTADLDAKWKHCAITQEPLQVPVMACELGRLYNKESVLELLLDRSKFECAASFEHLRGLKDLKQLNLTENGSFDKSVAEKGDAYIDTQAARYICPVSGLEMNGKYKFCFLWTCGCVLSDRALKEVKTETCHKCGKKFRDEDVVVLHGTDEEIEENTARMEQRRLKAKLEKKAKKAEKHKAESTRESATSECEPGSKKVRFDSSASSSKANGIVKSHIVNGKTNSTSKQINGSATETNARSIQKDPSASKTYKSLFTSSDAAKKQPKAHWVTYNPCFY